MTHPFDKNPLAYPHLLVPLIAKRGDYRLCIDILEHPFYPIGPNDKDQNHQTAIYAGLMCILSRTDNSLFDVENNSLFKQFVKLFTRSKKVTYALPLPSISKHPLITYPLTHSCTSMRTSTP